MTREEITQTIQHEIQQAQQPLLKRIDELEKQVDVALDWVSSLNVLAGIAMMNVPILGNSKAAEMLRDSFESLPPHQRSQKPAQLLIYWAARFDLQVQAYDDDTQKMDAINELEENQ